VCFHFSNHLHSGEVPNFQALIGRRVQMTTNCLDILDWLIVSLVDLLHSPRWLNIISCIVRAS
jgi:hypothetical protein